MKLLKRGFKYTLHRQNVSHQTVQMEKKGRIIPQKYFYNSEYHTGPNLNIRLLIE